MQNDPHIESLRVRILNDPNDIEAWRKVALIAPTAEDFENILFIINRVGLRLKLRAAIATGILFTLFLMVSRLLFVGSSELAELDLFTYAIGFFGCMFFPLVIIYTLLVSRLAPTELAVCHQVLKNRPTSDVFEKAVKYAEAITPGTRLQIERESLALLLFWIIVCGIFYILSADSASGLAFNIFCYGLILSAIMYGYFRLRSSMAGLNEKLPTDYSTTSDVKALPFCVTKEGQILLLNSPEQPN